MIIHLLCLIAPYPLENMSLLAYNSLLYAGIAQLLERILAKDEATS